MGEDLNAINITVELRRLHENMVYLINSAQLPTEAKRLVVCEVLHKLEVQADKELSYIIQQNNEEKESESE